MSTQTFPPPRRVVITGLGFITSIGNTREQVLTSLRELRTGIEYYPGLERARVPVRLAGTVKEFSFPELRSDEWTYPATYTISREHLRSMGPNALYGFCAMKQAIAEAQLPPEAQGEANGGPLGCCLGVTVALLLSLSFAIISHIYSVQLADLLHGWLSFTVKAVMIVFAIAASIALGYAGWQIGRRAFREYDPSPRQLKLAQQQERRLQRSHRRQRHEA